MNLQDVIASLRDRGQKMLSLNNPQDQDLVDIGADIGAGFLPVVGQAQAARDFERARRDNDKFGMALSSFGMIPLVGGIAKAGSVARRASKIDDVAELVEGGARQSPQAKAGAEQRMLTEAIGDDDRAKYLRRPTVDNPQRVAFPGIYKRPDELVAGAIVSPEDPLLQRLFGVTRDDLFQIAEEGRRRGNYTERPFKAAARAKGAKHAEQVMTERNEQRILDIIDEARKRPDLYKGMAAWYTMDPAYQHFLRLYGPERAAREYSRFNTLTGMASPGSEVLTELNRGTAANWLDRQGRWADFLRYGGGMDADTPADMAAVLGHPYHITAQGKPMGKYLSGGVLDMGSAKVPSYIYASEIPQNQFQTAWPVGDAHWSRLVGLADVRGSRFSKGKEVIPGASASVPEMVSLAPWWANRIAGRAGLESVPAQAVVWGAGSNATGVTSPIGAPKLELLSTQIGKAADRLGISPEEARDRIFLGQEHAGFADPALLGLLGAGTAGGLTVAALRNREKEKQQ